MVHELENRCSISDLILGERYSISNKPTKEFTLIVIEKTTCYVRVNFSDGIRGFFNIRDSSNTPFYEFPMSSLEKELV